LGTGTAGLLCRQAWPSSSKRRRERKDPKGFNAVFFFGHTRWRGAFSGCKGKVLLGAGKAQTYKVFEDLIGLGSFNLLIISILNHDSSRQNEYDKIRKMPEEQGTDISCSTSFRPRAYGIPFRAIGIPDCTCGD
jgi:hypothetical protein